jgi:hypothetical protein
MKQFLFTILFFALTLSLPLLGLDNFQLVEQWNHGDREPLTTLYGPFIDKDGHVVASFGKIGFRLISKDKVTSFAPMGQGPSDIYLCVGECRYKDDIAIMELSQKVKIFTKKDNTYKWKETKWLKRAYYQQITRDVLFYKDKWFIAGEKPMDSNKGKSGIETDHIFVKVYDSSGKPLARLIKKVYKKRKRHNHMDFYVVPYKSSVFFLAENELKVYEICTDRLKVVKKTNLEVPSFYKKMPEDFYIFKRYDDDPRGFRRDYEYWKVSYSRITKVVVENGYLVLQIRTFGEKQKKFALLFYNADTLKLEKTIPIDDYFMGARDGKYYFFANGNPGRDEDAEECIINIYAFKQVK